MLRVLGYYSTRDLIPLYGIYALLFRDHGLSAGAISSLFVIWSLTSFVCEIPSGAWADTVDRRRLLVSSALVYAAGFGVWTLHPTYLGFAAGFVLWGVSGAIMSGTFEALLYDELAARSATWRYPQLIGWAHSGAMAANLIATLLAAPLYGWGGYALVGWVSVAVAAVHGLLAWFLPATPTVASAEPETASAAAAPDRLAERYRSMLTAGLREATRHAPVRHAVLIAAAMLGLTVYDEYFPLVARDNGASTAAVPVLVGMVVAGQFIGTALAGRTAAMSSRAMAWVVAVSATLIAAGAISGHPAGFAAIAIGYGLVNNAIIVSEARLQEVITGPARATVTSVTGLSCEVVALSAYAAMAIGSRWLSVATLVALLGVPMLGVAVAVARWLPNARVGRDVSGRLTRR